MHLVVQGCVESKASNAHFIAIKQRSNNRSARVGLRRSARLKTSTPTSVNLSEPVDYCVYSPPHTDFTNTIGSVMEASADSNVCMSTQVASGFTSQSSNAAVTFDISDACLVKN